MEGYTFKEVEGNPSGEFTTQAQSVTYIYVQNKNNHESKSDHKDENNAKRIPSSLKHSLPKTGENEEITLISMETGIVLLTLVLVTSVLRFQKRLCCKA
ncbi:MucBP domain-containing protein [Enterococcus faecalis]|uniref:MucBP domain-containing protein n=1 Tax=Enterococcus faecalis TaxID=1351 RepID=UPI003CC5B4F6